MAQTPQVCYRTCFFFRLFFRIRALIPDNCSPGNRTKCHILRGCSHVSTSLYELNLASLFSNSHGLKLLQLVFLAEPEDPEEVLTGQIRFLCVLVN